MASPCQRSTQNWCSCCYGVLWFAQHSCYGAFNPPGVQHEGFRDTIFVPPNSSESPTTRYGSAVRLRGEGGACHAAIFCESTASQARVELADRRPNGGHSGLGSATDYNRD